MEIPPACSFFAFPYMLMSPYDLSTCISSKPEQFASYTVNSVILHDVLKYHLFTSDLNLAVVLADSSPECCSY